MHFLKKGNLQQYELILENWGKDAADRYLELVLSPKYYQNLAKAYQKPIPKKKTTNFTKHGKRLNLEQVKEIHVQHKGGFTVRQLSKNFGVSTGTISRCLNLKGAYHKYREFFNQYGL